MKPSNLWLFAAIVLCFSACSEGANVPVFVSQPLPDIPAECNSICPSEPQLPKRDITSEDIAKDRTAFKKAYRCERHQRRTCAARLKAVGLK